MNNLSRKNQIEQFVDDATDKVMESFGYTISQEQISDFRKYFEDILLFEIISCKPDGAKIFSLDNHISDNLSIALIASGISETGTLPRGKKAFSQSMPVTIETHHMAKERIKEIDSERLRQPFFARIDNYSTYNRNNQGAIPLPCELIELTIAQNERECGYVETTDREIYMSKGAMFTNWLMQRGSFVRYGLENSLACDICNEICTPGDTGRHYPLATNMALREMAGIDLFTNINGIENFKNPEALNHTLNLIKAAKITDRELIEPYEKRFLQKMQLMDDRGIKNVETAPKRKLLNWKNKKN